MQIKVSHIFTTDLEKARDAKRNFMKVEQDFPFQAKLRSECAATKDKGGDLGYITRGTMGQAFDDVAFSLQVGEVSHIVETDKGYHIIWRTE
jgi:parvulin-like peptidyl-prolyl isomerase